MLLSPFLPLHYLKKCCRWFSFLFMIELRQWSSSSQQVKIWGPPLINAFATLLFKVRWLCLIVVLAMVSFSYQYKWATQKIFWEGHVTIIVCPSTVAFLCPVLASLPECCVFLGYRSPGIDNSHLNVAVSTDCDIGDDSLAAMFRVYPAKRRSSCGWTLAMAPFLQPV